NHCRQRFCLAVLAIEDCAWHTASSGALAGVRHRNGLRGSKTPLRRPLLNRYRFGTQSEQFVRNFTIWKLRRSDSIFSTRSGVRNTLGLTTGVVTLAELCATVAGIRTPFPGTSTRRSHADRRILSLS